MRAFIAINIPEEIKETIEKIQKEIINLPIKCKMVERENLHITLSFLGEIDEKSIEKIKEKINEIVQKFKKFEVIINGIKLIPNEKYIRVIAFGIESKEMENLSNLIKIEIGGDVKPPHLTICRVKGFSNDIIKKNINKYDVISKILSFEKLIEKNNTFLVKEILLIKSDLSREGPKYTQIHSAKLSD